MSLVHGTGLIVGGVGLLIRGPSGAGKSLLALLLLDDAGLRGVPALLVADDQVAIEEGPAGLIMRTPARIAGLIELRGRGIVTRPHVDGAALHLLVDLVDELVRMPEDDAFSTALLGVPLGRCPVPRAGVVPSAHQLLLVREAVAQQEMHGGSRQNSA